MATDDDAWRRASANWQSDVRSAGLDPSKFEIRLCRTSIPANRFDQGLLRWTPYHQATSHHRGGRELAKVTVASVRVVTWNLFFSSSFWELRLARVLEEARAELPDVIAFQECTAITLDAILRTQWVRDEYVISDGGSSGTLLPYGVVVLSRLPVRKFVVFDMMSRMNRKFLLAEIELGDALVVVATVHLESLPASTPIRQAQLKLIHGALRPYYELASLVLLVGDMNIHDTWAGENAALVSTMTDLWPTLRPEDRGFTQNSEVNRMLGRLKRALFLVRYDRVLVATIDDWRPSSINLLGTAPASELGDVFASDHFGLVATVAAPRAAARCGCLSRALPWGSRAVASREHWEPLVTLPRADRSGSGSGSGSGPESARWRLPCARGARRPRAGRTRHESADRGSTAPPTGSPAATVRFAPVHASGARATSSGGAAGSSSPPYLKPALRGSQPSARPTARRGGSTSDSTSRLSSQSSDSSAMRLKRQISFGSSSARSRSRSRSSSPPRARSPDDASPPAAPRRVEFASALETVFSGSGVGSSWRSSSEGAPTAGPSEYMVDYVGFESGYATDKVALESHYVSDAVLASLGAPTDGAGAGAGAGAGYGSELKRKRAEPRFAPSSSSSDARAPAPVPGSSTTSDARSKPKSASKSQSGTRGKRTSKSKNAA